MITKFDLINEALTSKMFHFTSVHKLVNILKENAFFTTPVIGTGADSNVNDGKFYYFAMQTSRHGEVAFAGSVARTGKVCINIDGQKLNQNFKSKRVDYWQTSRNPKDHKPHNYMQHLTRFDELEERIITNKSEIPNAKKYIEEIHVLINGEMPDYIARSMVELKKHIKGVNIYFYKDEKYFNNQAKWAAILNFDDIDFEKDIDKDRIPHVEYRIPLKRVMSLMVMGDDELKDKLFKWLEKSKEVEKTLADRNRQFKGTNSELTIENLYKLIDKKSKEDYTRYLEYNGLYLDDYINVTSADIHNSKSSTNSIARYVIHELTKDMDKHNVKNIKDYILYKKDLMDKSTS